MSRDSDRISGKAFDLPLIRRILGLVRPYRTLFLVAVAAMAALVVARLLSVEVLKRLVDDVLRPAIAAAAGPRSEDALRDAYAGIAAHAGAIGALLLGSAALQVLQMRCMHRVAQRAMRDLRDRLFAHVHAQPLRFFDRNPVGRLVTRVVGDVDAMAEVLTSGIDTICVDLFQLVLIVGWLLWVDWKLTLVVMAVMPPLWLVSRLFRDHSRRAFRDVREKVAQLNSTLQESIQGLRVIQAFGREGRSAVRFRREDRELRDAHLSTVRSFALLFPATEFLSSAARVLLLWWGGRQIAGDRLTHGELVQFVLAMELFFDPIRDISESFTTMQSSMAAAERVFALLDRRPEIESPSGGFRPSRLRGEVEFRGVSFAYEEGRPAIRDVTFRVAPGETVALVGATGAGKTTVASLVTRLYDADSGAVLVDGEDVRRWDLAALRGGVTVVPQEVFLFAGTIEENLRIGDARITRESLLEACAAVGADRLLARLPKGIDTPVAERGASLSVGERQLLAMARALAQDPAVLVLDEATSSVDSETEALVESAIAKLQGGRTSTRTTIIVAHRLSTIRRADRILVFHHGELREQGTHAELVADDGIYATLHRLQQAA